MKLILLSIFLSVATFAQIPPIEPGVSHDLAKWRAARYSDVRYKLNLTLEKMSPVLKGTIEIRLNYILQDCQECPERYIVLDWRKIKGNEALSVISNVSINSSQASVLKSGEVSVGSEVFRQPLDQSELQAVTNGRNPTRYEEHDEHLIFREGVVAGENVIKLDFTSPILTSGSAITRYVDKEDGAEYIYSLFVPSDASIAFPVFDQPDLKARFELFVTHPDGWKVVSNTPVSGGFSSATIEQGGKQIVSDPSVIFAETKPISTYVFALAAGPFAEVSEPGAIATGFPGAKSPVAIAPGSDPAAAQVWSNIYVRKSQAAKFKPHAAEVFRLNREGIKFLETYFDYKFPFPKYDIVLIPEFPFGGMEHAGATFLRESSVIFPQEPTKNDYISRANLIFHEAAHQWFGDTVTMKWFDDLWLKEGFAEFMAYKTLEQVMPEYNAWKIFYERNKQAAYLTDSTKGTTPIYQEIANLNSAKSAYGNIVYRKAPSFLKQAEFFIGPDKFQTAVRTFLKKHEFANAGWEDLMKEFEIAGGYREEQLKGWAATWVKQRGLGKFKVSSKDGPLSVSVGGDATHYSLDQSNDLDPKAYWQQRMRLLLRTESEDTILPDFRFHGAGENVNDAGLPIRTEPFLTINPNIKDGQSTFTKFVGQSFKGKIHPIFIFPNHGDYGYGIFLLDDKSRDYILKNIQNEKDDFLRTMMWGSLWDSVREAELDPKDYVELVVNNIKLETDESTIQTLLGRVSTAMRYYLSEPGAVATGSTAAKRPITKTKNPVATAPGSDLNARVENLLIDRMQNASTPGQRITYYRAFLNIASSQNARRIMKAILKGSTGIPAGQTRGGQSGKMPDSRSTKDRFDIVGKLIILGDPEAHRLLADLEKTETSDEAKRYAYAAKAGFATAENKAKFWNDFVNNKQISESWIEAALGPFNSIRHIELTLPYLERALAELPKHKSNRKIFFVNGWLGAFIGGQRGEQALTIVNKFLTDNPNLDKDLRLKILENVDTIERAVKIRDRYKK